MWNDEYYDEDFSNDYSWDIGPYYKSKEIETKSIPTILYPIF